MRTRDAKRVASIVSGTLVLAIFILLGFRVMSGDGKSEPVCTYVYGHIERNETDYGVRTISLLEITDQVFLSGNENGSKISVDTVRVLNAGVGRFVELCVEPHSGGIEAYRSIVSGEILPDPTPTP